jgi:hypothetical protein
VIFVADSDPEKMDENIESYANLIENLAEYGKDVRELPHVIQYNKRDLPNALPVTEMDKRLNKFGVPTFEAVAYTGEGVFPTLKTLAAMVLESIERIDGRNPRKPAAKPAAGAQKPPAAPAAAAAAPTAAAKAPAARAAAPAAAPAKPAAAGRKPAAATAPAAPAAAPRAAAKPAAAARRATAVASAAPIAAAAPGRAEGRARRGGGMGVVVALTVMLVVAAAGVAYFFLGNQ